MAPSKLAGRTIAIHITKLDVIQSITIFMFTLRQMLAILVTLLFALGGGALTGLLMMCVARIQVNSFVIISTNSIIIKVINSSPQSFSELLHQEAKQFDPPCFEHDPVDRLPGGLAQGAAL